MERIRRGSLASNGLDRISPKWGSKLTNNPVQGLSLKSPCFVHSRFDQCIDFDKVVAEIGLAGISHPSLMQTATGVREIARQFGRASIRLKVKRLMIVTKARDNSLIALTRDMTIWLLAKSVSVCVDEKLKTSERFDQQSILNLDGSYSNLLSYWTAAQCFQDPESYDLVVTLGGDGTVLHTSWLFQQVVPPIIAFSLGSLGFLTNFKYENYQIDLTNALAHGIHVSLRMRFSCTIWRHDVADEQFEVLNEVVISRGKSAALTSLELYTEDNLLTVVQADGLIVSTPTGSTAYSLSAGGSLVHPDIPALLITPICPHTLSFRPILLSDSVELRIVVPEASRQSTVWVSFDGKSRFPLKRGDSVTIRASPFPFPTVQSSSTEWTESVSRTLRWNVRDPQKPFEKTAGFAEDWDLDGDGYSDDHYNAEL